MMRKTKGDGLTERRPLYVPFTPLPKTLRVMKGGRKAVEMAVDEGEVLARILEHDDLTPEIANTIRALTAGACLYVAKQLDTHHADPQLVREVYPWGRLAHPALREMFDLVIGDMQRDMPRMSKELFPDKGGNTRVKQG